jgi:hypothetical protein
MPVIDLTKTEEYHTLMEQAIEANKDWFEGLGYGDADFDLKAWMLWHRVRDGVGEGDKQPRKAPHFNYNK